MQQELTTGVHFNFEKQNKFKNVAISIDFIEPLANDNLVERTMVAEMMENYSTKYNSKLKVARKLAELYGARFGTNLFKVGDVVALRVGITFINEHFLNDNINLVNQICDFLQEMIFHPYLIDESYPTGPFELQRNNLVDYLNNLNDNKKYYAARQTKKLYFADDPQNAKLIFGDVADLATVTPQQAADYYHKMIKQNEIYISVQGDLNQQQLTNLKQHFQFTPRPNLMVKMKTNAANRPLRQQTELAVQKQSQLDLMYDFPVNLKSDDYYAALVMNALLGGSATSLMFLNIRERESLAYYISSSYNSTMGFFMIQSGIDGNNAEKVRVMIQQQINNLIEGNYAESLLNKVKTSLISGYLTNFDSERKSLNDLFIKALVNQPVSKNEWISNVKAIDKADIAAVARKLVLKSVFLLKGENDE
ncbi:EF-P 5-aminopentanol modification-associated protein YfmF [Fructilactobacillus frigidiflavus]|uniref:EF-P 5-aminopentanol modification-associated protein YfmF n=3 Tax=Fructilactobacillus frigidiflavus TaxID=3242688 RepID=UPI003757F5D2